MNKQDMTRIGFNLSIANKSIDYTVVSLSVEYTCFLDEKTEIMIKEDKNLNYKQTINCGFFDNVCMIFILRNNKIDTTPQGEKVLKRASILTKRFIEELIKELGEKLAKIEVPATL